MNATEAAAEWARRKLSEGTGIPVEYIDPESCFVSSEYGDQGDYGYGGEWMSRHGHSFSVLGQMGDVNLAVRNTFDKPTRVRVLQEADFETDDYREPSEDIYRSGDSLYRELDPTEFQLGGFLSELDQIIKESEQKS